MKMDTLSALINEGHSIRVIGKKLNTSYTNVRYWLKRHNLKTKRGPRGTLVPDPNRRCHCRFCGETNPKKFYGHHRATCSECSNQFTIKEGRERRDYVVEKLGGKCVTCGYNKYPCSLDVHHINPKTKDANFSKWKGWSYKRIDKEIEQCILLCKNCHAALHAGFLCAQGTPKIRLRKRLKVRNTFMRVHHP